MAESVAIRKTSSILDAMQDMQKRIMRRAYEIFENNGSVFGRELDNWLQAEQELLWIPAIELRENEGSFLRHRCRNHRLRQRRSGHYRR